MEQYLSYKASSIPWLKAIPEHWAELRFKYIAHQITGGEENELPKLGLENIESGTGEYIPSESNFEGKGVRFETCDILYGKLRPYLQKVWKASFSGNAVGDFFVFRSADISNSNFLKYFLLSEPFTEMSNGATEGAKMPRVGIDFINNLSCPVPPALEQKEIASWLDDKCLRIKIVISKVDDKIAQLQRLRKAIIANAVFRGINFRGTLRESGLGWMPQIPSHWETIRLKRLGRFFKGLTFTKSDLVEEGHKVVSYGQVHSKSNSGVSLSEELIRYVPDSIVEKGEKAKVNKGSFIFADTSEDLEGCGNCIYNDSSEILYAGYHTIILQMNDLADNRYLAYLFLTDEWRSQIRNSVNGVKVYSITQAIMNQCDVILPPKAEQTEIADYLDDKCMKIDNLIAKYEKQKELLARYRKAIITQAVTGQICVCSDEVLKLKDYEDVQNPARMAAEP